MRTFSSLGLRCSDGKTLEVLDQRELPDTTLWHRCDSVATMVELIKCLAVRGAPAIGIAAAACLALEVEFGRISTRDEILSAAKALRESRPTAVNLMVCIDAMTSTDLSSGALNAEFDRLYSEDVSMCERMSEHGRSLVAQKETILTHCNTGSLATAGVGTAIGVIRKCHESGLGIDVFVSETRPLLQGGRLTAWELTTLGVPNTLITDSMAASLMRAGKISRVLVGADRIALNGDFANKIGTYSIAVLSKFHNVPFHVVAPISTIDFDAKSAEDIPIEERNHEEVRGAKGAFGTVRWAPEGCKVYNPAFDVTPAELVTSWILDTGVLTKEDIDAGAIERLGNSSSNNNTSAEINV